MFLAMRKKWPRFAKWIRWLLGLGVFLTLSSLVMIKIYPAGTTFMCVAVPVLMLLSVVFFLYQREFFVEAVALTVTLVLVTLLNRSISTALFEKLVQVGAYGSMLVFAAAFAVLLMVKKNNGRLGKTELFPAKTDYTLLCAVMVFCIAVIAVSLFTAWGYYMVWASAVVLFGLAVWYTVKML